MFSLVIDNGSTTIRCGYIANAGYPSYVAAVPARVLKHKNPTPDVYHEQYVADWSNADTPPDYQMHHPIKDGIIVEWDEMISLWQNIFTNQLHLFPEEYAVLHNEQIFNPRENRERTCELMFEFYNFPAMHLANKQILSAFATHRKTGVVVNCGSASTKIVPMYEGFILKDAVQVLAIGGNDLTKYLKELLSKKGYEFQASNRFDPVKHLKEKFGFVALDYAESLKEKDQTIEYTIDKEVVRLGKERFMCAEPLFQPSLLQVSSPGLSYLLYKCINNCDISIKGELFTNIILVGGTTLFLGFPERLKEELAELAPSTEINIIAQPDRNSAAWAGARVFGQEMMEQNNLWILKEHYDEEGPRVVHSYCI